MNITWEWIIGALLVYLYAQGRFNNPKSNKTSTTRLRYYSAFVAYLSALYFLFVLIGGGITESPSLIRFITQGGSEIDSALDTLPGPLLAALLLTTLLPNFPILSTIDKWLMESFQRMGNIPWAVTRLSGKLQRCEFQVPEHLRQTLLESFPTLGERDFNFEADDSLEYMWSRCASIYTSIRTMSEQAKYDRCFSDMREEYKNIQNGFEHIRTKATTCFQLSSNKEFDDEAVSECRRNLNEQLQDFFDNLCDFLARGVLTCEFTKTDRDKKLESLGFNRLSQEKETLNADQIVTISGVVFLVLAVGMLVIGSATTDLKHVFRIASQVAIVYGFAVVAAIYPKTIWSFANIQKTGRRPVMSYLLSGFIAFGISIVVSMTFKFIMLGNFVSAVSDVGKTYPWSFMSFTLALITAVFADNSITSEKPEPKWLRWLEALATAVLLSGATWIVRYMLVEIPGLQPYRIPPLERMLFTSFVIGSVVGYLVPHWYRSASDENAKRARDMGPAQIQGDLSAARS